MATLMGKKVVVVGGSSGIGLGVAAAALEKGAGVVIVGRSPEKLEAAEKSLAAGNRVTTVAADMAKEGEITRMFEAVGAFDHLVSTAGGPPAEARISEVDVEIVRRFIDDKLIGNILVAKHAVHQLQPGGSITFTSGINKDKPPVPGGSVVAAIAGSFSYLAHALALELGPTRVNVVSPGWVDTPLFAALAGDGAVGYLDGMAASVPAGRVATPADIAPAYIFAMESDFTTGETIHVDGGQRLI